MKIVQRGTHRPQYPWVGRYLCATCGTVIDLQGTDAAKVMSWDDDQRDGMSVRIHCPICDEVQSLMQFDKTTTYAKNRAKWDALT